MKLKMFTSLTLALIMGVIAAGSLWAHHNMRAAFDLNQRFTRTGTLTKVDWTFPHLHLLVDAKIEQGQVEKWSFEGPSPNTFKGHRAAFEGSLNKTVTVEASPARNGSRSGLIREVRLTDGQVVVACPQNC